MALAKLQPQRVSLYKRIKAGLQSVSLMSRLDDMTADAQLRTRVVNKTGCRMVLRTKYRNVWEGERLTLAPGESVLVRWAPSEPYERLGAFMDTGSGLNYEYMQLQLLIAQHTLASNKEITLLRSPSFNHVSLSLSPRRPLPS